MGRWKAKVSPAPGRIANGSSPAGGPTQERSAGRWFWLFAVALVAATIFIYCPAWQGEPIIDDDIYITPPHLRSARGLWRIWSELGSRPQYNPLCHSVFWLQYRLWGDSMFGYHLVNIVLHGIAAVMFAMILRRLEIPGAYLAAAIFALHPVHVESVAWITELKNALSAVFYLGAMLAYLRFDQTRRKTAYAIAGVLFVLGMLSKTVTGTLPAALLVIFWWKRGRLSWKRDVLPLAPLFVLGLAGGLLTAWIERIGIEGAQREYGLTLIERCLVAGRAVWFYLGKLFCPAELSFIYPRWKVSQAVWWQYLFPIGAVLLLVALWSIRNRSRAPLAAMLFFIGTLFPAAGFVYFGWFQFSYVADHLQYLPSLGVISLFAAGLATLARRFEPWGRTAFCSVAAAILISLAILTWLQSGIYANAVGFYRAALARNQECPKIHLNLGAVLAEQGELDEAASHYRQALRIDPNYLEAHNNLGIVLMNQGELDAAIDHYRQVLRIDPNLAEVHYNLGVAFGRQGKLGEAVRSYGRALALRPRDSIVRSSLAFALVKQGKLDEAIEQYRQLLRVWPDHVGAHVKLGELLTGAGSFEEAVGHYERALQLRPDVVAVLNNLAWLLATEPSLAGRDPAQAVRLAEKACELTRRSRPDCLDTLAAAYAAAGRFGEAVATAKEAIGLAEAAGRDDLAGQMRKHLAVYEAGRPWREP